MILFIFSPASKLFLQRINLNVCRCPFASLIEQLATKIQYTLFFRNCKGKLTYRQDKRAYSPGHPIVTIPLYLCTGLQKHTSWQAAGKYCNNNWFLTRFFLSTASVRAAIKRTSKMFLPILCQRRSTSCTIGNTKS